MKVLFLASTVAHDFLQSNFMLLWPISFAPGQTCAFCPKYFKRPDKMLQTLVLLCINTQVLPVEIEIQN